MADNALEHITNQAKNCLSTLHRPPYSPNMVTNDLHLFHSLEQSLVEKLLIDAEVVKTCLNHCLPSTNCDFSLFRHAQTQTYLNQILYTSSIKVIPSS